LKDLFSLRNTKKRDINEITTEEEKQDKWITNKRKMKRKYEEDS
jgi:hypothetical protein